MFEPIRDEAQGQRLSGSRCFFLGAPVGCDARQRGYVGEPAAIGFPVVFDGKRKSVAQALFQHGVQYTASYKSAARLATL